MTRIAFFGTPKAAVPALEALLTAGDIEVAAVVTNPDRPRGRSGEPVAPPVKVAAVAQGLPLWQPQKAIEIVDELGALELDAGAVVAYGSILPAAVLRTGGLGFVNLHFSLLPRWRGAAPVQHAIRAGDQVTGVTTFVLDEGMDTGPILDRLEVPIGPAETAGSLTDRLAAVGAPLLVDAVRALAAGVDLVPQSADGATLAPKLGPDDTRIDWTAATRAVVDLVRSANPAPGAHTTFGGSRLKVWLVEPAGGTGAPGEVLDVSGGMTVGTCDGAVRLVQVQPQGKGRMDGAGFVNGYRPQRGDLLGA